MKVNTVSFWVAVLGAAAAVGLITTDQVDGMAEMVAGVIVGIMALWDTLGIGGLLGGDKES